MTIHAKHQMTTRTRMMGVVGDSNSAKNMNPIMPTSKSGNSGRTKLMGVVGDGNSEKNKNPIMSAPTKSKHGSSHKATY